MDLVWYGGSCVRLRAGPLSILADPFDLPRAADLSADIVTLSQRDARERLLVTPPYRLVDGPGEYEIKYVPITGIATRHLLDGTRWNIVYSVVVDGVTICHLGRLNRAPTSHEVQDIGSPDVLLLPLGGAGLAVAQAVALASQLEAKLLVPMPLGAIDDRSVLERFCKELGADAAASERRLTVTSGGLPATARVAVLEVPGGQGPSLTTT